MTVHDAIDEIRRVGTIRLEAGKLKLRFPEPELGRLGPAIQTLRQNREASLRAVAEAAMPKPADWPQSPAELADEIAERTGEPAAARREVWLSWAEWKAAMLNKLFLEQGVLGEPAKILPETVRHGERGRK